MSTVKLQSSDGKIFDVDLKAAKMSKVIENLLENFGEDGDEVIPVTTIDGSTLEKIIQWIEHHKNDQPSIQNEDEKRTDDICGWDVRFISDHQTALFEILMAANYLDIEELYKVCCKTIANMIKGKTAEQIREHFGVSADE